MPQHVPSAVSHHARRPWVEFAFFLFLAILFLVPGLNRGLIFDEYKTRMVAELGWAELFRERLGAGHLPTYFAMVKGWLLLLPYSNWAMRVPGAVFAALGAVPFYFIGRMIGGRSAGRWVAFIYLANQLVIWAGQAARPYGPLLFFEGLTVWAALMWWRMRMWRWLLLTVVASIGGIIMMPLFGLVGLSLVLGAIAVWRRSNTERVWPLVMGLVVSMAVGFLPAILVASSQSKLAVDRGWQIPRFDSITDALATMVYGDYDLWARGIMEYVAQLIFLLILFFAFRRWSALVRRHPSPVTDDPTLRGEDLPWRTWALFWIFAPLVALVLVAAFTRVGMVNHSRYQTPALGGVIFLFGIAMARFRATVTNRWVRDGVSLLVVLPLVITAVAWHRDPGEGVAPVAHQMQQLSGGEVPAQVAGHVRWLRIELPPGKLPRRELFIERRPLEINEILVAEARAKGHDVTVIDYDKQAKDVSHVREAIEAWAGGAPFWLFVYIQEKDGLDRLAKSPPQGFELIKTIRKGYARAYYFEPAQN